MPDGYSQILRPFVFGPSGFRTMAPIRCAAKFDPFLSLDRARVEGVGRTFCYLATLNLICYVEFFRFALIRRTAIQRGRLTGIKRAREGWRVLHFWPGWKPDMHGHWELLSGKKNE